MNQKELIDEICSRTGITKKESKKVISAMKEIIGEKLQSGECVSITGLGKFYTGERKECIHKDLNTGLLSRFQKVTVLLYRYSEVIKNKVKK